MFGNTAFTMLSHLNTGIRKYRLGCNDYDMSFKNWHFHNVFMCAWSHLSSLPAIIWGMVALSVIVMRELAGSCKCCIQFPALSQASCMTLADSRNPCVTQFLICPLSMWENEVLLFVCLSLWKALMPHLLIHSTLISVPVWIAQWNSV